MFKQGDKIRCISITNVDGLVVTAGIHVGGVYTVKKVREDTLDINEWPIGYYRFRHFELVEAAPTSQPRDFRIMTNTLVGNTSYPTRESAIAGIDVVKQARERADTIGNIIIRIVEITDNFTLETKVKGELTPF